MLKLSQFGQKLTARSGILELMEDLGKAMSGNEKMYMLGGGNPAHIPEVQKVWRTRMQEILANGVEFDNMLTNYDTPQGNTEMLQILADFLHREYGWNIGSQNIAITNGSQSAFFFLFNILGGKFENGTKKHILLPMVPEYIGYADQGLDPDLFISYPPLIEKDDSHGFKYYIDFDALKVDESIGAICVSRPTNPTGNVLTDTEIDHLSKLAKDNNIPLIIDNAYGLPFPGILFTPATLTWEPHIILSMSLSKIGLPSTRTGIILASEEIISALSSLNAVVSLASGSIGQNIIKPLVQSGEILNISKNVVRPFYEKRSLQTQNLIRTIMPDNLPYHIHRSEGALFLWLWFENLPISSRKLYERLKKCHTLIIPGEYFFTGLYEPWKHSQECIRITYSQKEEDVSEGIKILCEEVQKAYED